MPKYKTTNYQLFCKLLENASESDECVEWMGYRDPFGIGRIYRAGKIHLAHRLAWEISVGPIPKGSAVYRKCNNPSCFRPSHLAVGTQGDVSANGRRWNPQIAPHVRTKNGDDAVAQQFAALLDPSGRLLNFAFLQEMLQTIPEGDTCLEWPRGRNMQGYGVLATSAGKDSVHRAAYTLAVGPIPSGMDVCHKCDNPPCFRPDHLFVGTRKENVRDSMAKGRFRDSRGEKHPGAKLTDNDVREIRALRAQGWVARDLAVKFRISHQMAYFIYTRRNWSHVPD